MEKAVAVPFSAGDNSLTIERFIHTYQRAAS